MKEQNAEAFSLLDFKNLENLIAPMVKRMNFVVTDELSKENSLADNLTVIMHIADHVLRGVNRIDHLNECDKSIVYWLIVVGSYPNTSQQKVFETRIQTYGFHETFLWLIQSVLCNQDLYNSALSTILVHDSAVHLVDITHTSNYPHTTGIQRVVRRISQEAKELAQVSFIKWDVSQSRVIVLEKDALFNSSHLSEIEIFEEKFLQEIFNKLYLQLGLWAESGFFRHKIKIVLRPITRKIKSAVNGTFTGNVNPVNGKENVLPRENVYIFGHTITLLDVGMEHGPLYYPYLINSSVKLQAVLYDVIPIFHPEFFKGSGLTNLFSNYLSYVLKFNKLVAISSVVAEQANLLNKAISIERPGWGLKETLVENIDLPPGVYPSVNFNAAKPQKSEELFIMVATIEPRKNHVQFLNALLILKQLGIPVKGVLIGINGWDNQQVYEKILECTFQGVDVKHLEKVSDIELHGFYDKATAVLSLSEAEGYGLPLVEAATFGTTVIASRIRPFLDLKIEDIHFVDIGDALGLAEIMLGLMENSSTVGLNRLTSNSGDLQPTWRDWSDRLFS